MWENWLDLIKFVEKCYIDVLNFNIKFIGEIEMMICLKGIVLCLFFYNVKKLCVLMFVFVFL